jgi:hypothetical protein
MEGVTTVGAQPVNRRFLLCGIAFVAVLLVAIIGVGGGTPGTGASAEKLASFYSDNDVRQGIGTFVLAAAAPFVVLFGVGLMTAVGRRDGGEWTAWSWVLLTGTILVAGSVLVTAFVHFALTNGGDEDISPTALEALNSLDANAWMMFNPAFGVMMLGAAGALLTTGAHRILGWIALVIGLAAFIPIADFFALLGTLVWIVVTSIVLARAKTANQYVAAPGAALEV